MNENNFLESKLLNSLILLIRLSAPKATIIKKAGNIKIPCLVVVKVNFRSKTKIKNIIKKEKQLKKTLDLLSIKKLLNLELNLDLKLLKSIKYALIIFPKKE